MLIAITATDVIGVKLCNVSNIPGVSFILKDGNELFIAKDTMRAVSIIDQPPDGGIVLFAGESPKVEILRVAPNGQVFVHGRLAGTDADVFEALQHFAKESLKKDAVTIN